MNEVHVQFNVNSLYAVYNVVVTCKIKLFQKLVKRHYCNSWIFSNMFIVTKIISEPTPAPSG